METQDKTLVINLVDIMRSIQKKILYVFFIGVMGALIAFLIFEKSNNTIKATSYIVFDDVSYDLLKTEMDIDMFEEFYKYDENELLELKIKNLMSGCGDCARFSQFVISGSNRSNLKFSASMATEAPEIAESTFNEVFRAVQNDFNKVIFNKYTYLLDLAQRRQEISQAKRNQLINEAKELQNFQFNISFSNAKYNSGIDSRAFLENYLDFENPTDLFVTEGSPITLKVLGSGFNYFPILGFLLSSFFAIIFIIIFRNYRFS